MPKRSDQRMGHRAKADEPQHVNVVGVVKIPRVNPKWNATARALYRSLRDSGHSKYMEPSDWQAAQLAADTTTIAAETKSADMMKLAWRMWTDLMVNESSRRRAGIEVYREAAPPPAATPDEEPETVSDHRARLTAVS